MKKREKVIILGGSGSGKDFLMRKLTEKGLVPCLKWTTRPIRKYEEHGITYNFVSDIQFQEAIDNNNFLCYQVFEVTPLDSEPLTWYYGITNEEFERAQVFIMTPEDFTKVTPEMRKGCFVVYLDIDRSIKESRLYKREDKNDSVKRRLDSDVEDFKNLSDYDLRITDHEFGVNDIYDLME